MRWPFARSVIWVLSSCLLVACSTPQTSNPATTTPGPTTSPSAATAASAAPDPTASAPATAAPTPTPRSAVPTDRGLIAAGYDFTCAVSEAGGVRCWGANGRGQLGNGATSEAPSAGLVDVAGLEGDIVAIASGGSHACALSDTGGVSCWGANDYGELGDMSYVDSAVPVDVAGLTSGVTAISAGWAHTCAVTERGGVQCWGHNPFGGLGDGSRRDSGVPVDVAGLPGRVIGIAAGGLHTCALSEGGGVWCWGDGQADDPEVGHSAVPVEVARLAGDVTSISASMSKTCALATDGQLTCWGSNLAPPPGQTLPDRFVTIDVSGIDGEVAQIALGESHACVLSNLGAVSCWGNNGSGELGQVTLTAAAVPAPMQVPGLGSAVRSIAVGGQHTCALTGGDVVQCWGSNTRGQLGRATRCSSTSIPIDVPLDGGVGSTLPDPDVPSGRIGHATGSTDVVLRYDAGPDIGISELGGDQFAPGAEFTLYGDGTVIYRNERTPLPPADSLIVRERPFMTARLDDDQVQALLRFAVDDGGLATACERYETNDTDVSESVDIAIRTDPLVKRVQVAYGSDIGPLLARLRDYEPDRGVRSTTFVPDRYWAVLLEPTEAIELGILPRPAEVGSAPWPWPDIAPDDFVPRDEGGWSGYPRRVLSATEAAVLGLSDDGGVVRRVYLVGPDRTIYLLSVWPMHPEEAG